jgi:hypothetical protein
MDSIRGKRAVSVDPSTLARQIAAYINILIDLGTGDGRFVRHAALSSLSTFAIGIDLCAANLRETSRRAPANTLFLLASAYAPPRELRGLATHLTINFPWGELLTGLLSEDRVGGLATSVASLCRQGALLEVRLNCGALAEAGWSLQNACSTLRLNLSIAGFRVARPQLLDAGDLRACETTWARRLAFGRDPRALYFRGVKIGEGASPLQEARLPASPTAARVSDNLQIALPPGA